MFGVGFVVIRNRRGYASSYQWDLSASLLNSEHYINRNNQIIVFPRFKKYNSAGKGLENKFIGEFNLQTRRKGLREISSFAPQQNSRLVAVAFIVYRLMSTKTTRWWNAKCAKFRAIASQYLSIIIRWSKKRREHQTELDANKLMQLGDRERKRLSTVLTLSAVLNISQIWVVELVIDWYHHVFAWIQQLPLL